MFEIKYLLNDNSLFYCGGYKTVDEALSDAMDNKRKVKGVSIIYIGDGEEHEISFEEALSQKRVYDLVESKSYKFAK